MEYQTIKEKGKVKFVVLPIELFETLLDRLEVKQPTVAKWERKEAIYRKKTRQKLARVFRVTEETFL